MDTKALAKSKRAHSLHHSKKHHHQASKAPSTNTNTASSGKNLTGKQIRVKPQQSQGSRTLPPNWDRYGEEFDMGAENMAQGGSTSQPNEFVVPKSKGADYAHMILEASQSLSNYSSETFPSFTDVLDDFTQDFGPLLSAKGQSMLSWIADDNFEVEEKSSTSHEAPFLSLNLTALAEQLAKAKPSEMLFLDPDVLPPELLDDELLAYCVEEHNKEETCTSAVAMDSGSSSLAQYQEENGNDQQDHEPVPSIAVTEEITVPTSKEGFRSTNQIKDDILEIQGTSESNINRNAPMFAAANAEAELDMLLNSFGEIDILQSSREPSDGNITNAGTRAQTGEEGARMIKAAIAPYNIDDAIDNLLEETLDLKSLDTGGLSHGVKASVDVPSLNPSSKSKLLDDFDSWLDTI